jgi:RNA polymerase sigma factor (sigma-70 family)
MKSDPIRTDEQLIEQFLSGGPDEAEPAFEALVKRHGPMVMAVCRHILGRSHDAEDAFQATFLALALHAGAIRDRRLLAAWLHEVGTRSALRLRAREARLRSRTLPAGEDVAPGEAESALARDELRLILHVELERLPEKYRTVVAYCHLEGKSYSEAAGLVGCPVGTVKGRLWRARGLLRQRLSDRGLDAEQLACLRA